MNQHLTDNWKQAVSHCVFQPWIAVVAIGLLLSGCAVGPDFHRPAVHTPKSWLNETSTTVARGILPVPPQSKLASWWQAFNDPILNQLIDRGIKSNLDLMIAAQRLRQARGVVGEAASAWWPTFNVNGQYQRSHTRTPRVNKAFSSGNGNTGGEGSFASSGSAVKSDRSVSNSLYQAGFDSAWEMDIFGGTRREVEAARADEQANLESLRDTLITLTAEIGTDYLQLRGRQEQLRITRENLKSQEHSAEITRKHYQAGFVSELDVADAEAQVATTQAQIPALEDSVRQMIYQLGLLLGEEPGALADLLTTDRPLPSLPRQIPTGLPSDLLERRPDIRGAEASLHAATARIGVAIAELFPKFTLTGSMNIQASKLASWDRTVTSVGSFGPSISWNIFNGWLTRHRIEENKALADQRKLEYRKTILNALQEVESNWTSFDKEIERGRSLETAVARNRRAVALANRLYAEGQNDFLSVLLAQRSLLLTQDALVQSHTQAARSLVALYKALGGGWAMDDGAKTTQRNL